MESNSVCNHMSDKQNWTTGQKESDLFNHEYKGSVAEFTSRNNSESWITDIKILISVIFSRITKISK